MKWEWMLLAIVLGLAFMTDARRGIIPNWLTLGGMLSGFAAQIAVKGTAGIWVSGAGFAAGFGLMLLVYLTGALGAGDVKLFGALGAIAGWEFTVQTAVCSVMYAGLIGGVILLARKQLVGNLLTVFRFLAALCASKQWRWLLQGRTSDMTTFPFMYAVLPGAVTAGMGW